MTVTSSPACPASSTSGWQLHLFSSQCFLSVQKSHLYILPNYWPSSLYYTHHNNICLYDVQISYNMGPNHYPKVKGPGLHKKASYAWTCEQAREQVSKQCFFMVSASRNSCPICLPCAPALGPYLCLPCASVLSSCPMFLPWDSLSSLVLLPCVPALYSSPEFLPWITALCSYPELPCAPLCSCPACPVFLPCAAPSSCPELPGWCTVNCKVN